MQKFWWLAVIVIDVTLTNVHWFWRHSEADRQWEVWDSSMAGRVCLIPIIMLLGQKLDKWGELAVANYFAFCTLDFVQTLMRENHGFQIEEFVAYILLNFVMVHKWKQK